MSSTPIAAATSTSTRPPATRADSQGDVNMRDADTAKPNPTPSPAHAAPTSAATTMPVRTHASRSRSPPREPAEMRLSPPLASSHIHGQQAPQPQQQQPGPTPPQPVPHRRGAQLLTLAQIDAKVAEAARTLHVRFEGGHALFVDPFENRPVRISMHANQRNWRRKRITKQGRTLLAHESRLRVLADAKARHASDEAAAVAALEAIRRGRQHSDEKTQELAREHARVARSTGLLKLCTMIDGLYAQQKQSHVAEKTRKRARLQELRAEFADKRRRLEMSPPAIATTVATDASTAPLPVGAAPQTK